MLTYPTTQQRQATPQPAQLTGLRVRTNLRAGLAWDDLDDKAKELWNRLTNAVSNATNALTGSSSTTTPTA